MSAPIESMTQEAVNAIDPASFEPIIRQAADSIYDQLLSSVQDYLIDNTSFNLSSRMSTLESTVKQLRVENHNAAATIKELLAALEGFLAVHDNAGPMTAMDRVNAWAGASAYARAAIAKARGAA
jgi:hypothetical protein